MSRNNQGNVEEEFESSKLHFEDRLKSKLEYCSKLLANNDMDKFTLAVRSCWVDCFYEDKQAILRLGEKWAEKEYMDEFYDVYTIEEYLNADPNSYESFLFTNRVYQRKWIELYELIQEALKKRYTGEKRQWQKDDEYDVSEGDRSE